MPEPDSNLVALPIAKAAVALRLSTEAVRTRIRRGYLEARTGNDGRKLVLVLVPRSQLEATGKSEPGPDAVRTVTELAAVLRAELDRAVTERDQARSDVEGWRVKAEQARLDAVRAEAERDALRSELARLREPWWRRLIGMGVVAAVLAVLPATAQESAWKNVFLAGWGLESCGRFIEVRRTGPPAEEGLRQWVLGYLSAYNTFAAASGNVLNGADAATVMALVEQRCLANPRLLIAGAVGSLLVEEGRR